MSQNLSLVQYAHLDDGKLREEESTVIESAFFPSHLLAEIEKKFPLTTRDLFDDNGQYSSSIDCLRSDACSGILELLEREFVRLFEADEHQRLRELLVQSSIEEAITAFRSLTNLHHVIWLKENQLPCVDYAVLQLG
ncbi:hypothetical protein [Achromobacter kerstersii]